MQKISKFTVYLIVVLIAGGCASKQPVVQKPKAEPKAKSEEVWSEEKLLKLKEHEIDAKIFRLEASISKLETELYPKVTEMNKYPQKQRWRREFLKLQSEVTNLEIKKATLEETLAHFRSCRYTGVCEL